MQEGELTSFTLLNAYRSLALTHNN